MTESAAPSGSRIQSAYDSIKTFKMPSPGTIYTSVTNNLDYYFIQGLVKPALDKAPDWVFDNRVVTSIKNNRQVSIIIGGTIAALFVLSFLIWLHPKAPVKKPDPKPEDGKPEGTGTNGAGGPEGHKTETKDDKKPKKDEKIKKGSDPAGKKLDTLDKSAAPKAGRSEAEKEKMEKGEKAPEKTGSADAESSGSKETPPRPRAKSLPPTLSPSASSPLPPPPLAGSTSVLPPPPSSGSAGKASASPLPPPPSPTPPPAADDPVLDEALKDLEAEDPAAAAKAPPSGASTSGDPGEKKAS